MLERIEGNFILKFVMLLFIIGKLSCILPFCIARKSRKRFVMVEPVKGYEEFLNIALLQA
jgi:hypothetical protein